MSDARKSAIKALRPFAALAAEVEQTDKKLRDARMVLLSIGNAHITTEDLRLAAKTLGKLEKTK